MGKTAVFVSSILHRLNKNPEPCSALVLCHARELAFQIYKEFNRLGKYLTDVKTRVMYGGDPIQEQKKILQNDPPTIIVGTPGRILDLIRRKYLKLNNLKFFVLDECDKMLEEIGKNTLFIILYSLPFYYTILYSTLILHNNILFFIFIYLYNILDMRSDV